MNVESKVQSDGNNGYEINPFVQNITLPVIKKLSIQYRQGEQGFDSYVREIMNATFIEQQKHTSVYDISGIGVELFWKMKSSGRDLLLYVIYNIRKNTDWIVLDQDKVCQEMFCSKSTFYNSLEELQKIGIIAKKGAKMWWVNPIYVFRGNRIMYFQRLGDIIGRPMIEVVSSVMPKPKGIKDDESSKYIHDDKQ